MYPAKHLFTRIVIYDRKCISASESLSPLPPVMFIHKHEKQYWLIYH